MRSRASFSAQGWRGSSSPFFSASWMSVMKLRSGLHMPEKSAFPSAVRGAGPALIFSALVARALPGSSCPAAASNATRVSPSVITARIELVRRVFMRGLPVVNIRSDAIAYSISFPGEDLDRHVRVSRRELVVRQAHHDRDRLTTSGTGSPRAGQAHQDR